MAHSDPPEYEQYWQLAKWFFKSPATVERMIRSYGTIEDFEEFHLKLVALVEREERKRWFRTTILDFLKVFAAVGAGLLAVSGGLAVLQSWLPLVVQ